MNQTNTNQKEKRKQANQSLFLNKVLRSLVFITLVIFSATHGKAQTVTQQVRGTITDVILQTPVSGATVALLGKTVTTDDKGNFRFTDIPVGTHQLQVSHISYKEATLHNIIVNSGKETVLTVGMESKVQTSEAVIVKTSGKRNKPLNEMSAVSARAFTVEETQKYAAAVNDPLRMATGFPGVMAADDGSNSIIIRGNSPTGLLWRMEGIDIPNPNHYSSPGSSGGGISILSTQLLSNSDFITGAFAPEYGNALSGVFDLKLRKGNNEKREYTLQAGLLGLNAAAEGPLMRSNGGSYLINYRYSTLSVLEKMGVPVTGGTTNFQDLSYHFYLPMKRAGNFSLFGFTGLSSQFEKADRDSLKWEGKEDRYNSNFISNTTANGLTHSILLGSKTNLKSAIAYSYNKIGSDYQYMLNDYSLREDYRDKYTTKKLTVSSTANHKFSPKSTLRTGGIVSFINFNYNKKDKEHDNAPLETVINTKGKTQTVQAFTQWQYKPADRITVNGGLHYLQLLLNNTYSIEPRASVKYQLNRANSVAFGYGKHSQVQSLGIYFAQATDINGSTLSVNKNLELTKAHHYVLSFQHSFNSNLALKAEAYYQSLYNVPVSTSDTNTLSALNIEAEYVTDPMVNEGTGRNYGLEVSLEKYLSNHFYYTLSTSLYQSKYTAKDGVERNTRFNGNTLTTLLAGKEFVSSNGLKTFGINIKTIYAGGLRTTPIDEDRSRSAGYGIYKQKEAYTLQNPAYFRGDLRVSMKWNRKHLTSTLSLDIQNLTNRQNVFGQYFDSEKNKIVTSYQTGLIPVLNYKVEF
jgi:hypothetical protein